MTFLAPLLLTAMTQAQPNFVPQPVSWTPARGSFTLNSKTTIVADGAHEPLGVKLHSYLRPATEFPLKVIEKAAPNSVRLRLDSRFSRLGKEGYRLDVLHDAVEIVAADRPGIFYGI